MVTVGMGGWMAKHITLLACADGFLDAFWALPWYSSFFYNSTISSLQVLACSSTSFVSLYGPALVIAFFKYPYFLFSFHHGCYDVKCGRLSLLRNYIFRKTMAVARSSNQ
ncbi:hypothetical protein B0T13DRAFT_62622 [Neurospora crassa]|nr:hypothetical protein B0T13DRAFT_62622 [Neurospora crassa]